ncbi:hypothetical protein MSAN_02212700 [Mycena sanguinolenta]|uniref:Uncharacterized protein n=1 Tax=Mycena sanguinolenta TaxID=230812 RepID=A0A8H6XCN4_9AGAR|nr:hypothetical protein MSAN_02212700 [Mycena sanguinolenta]
MAPSVWITLTRPRLPYIFSLTFCPPATVHDPIAGTMRVFSWYRFGVEDTFDPQYKFVSSPFLSPYVLAGIRTLLALYSLCTVCTVLAFDVSMGLGKSFLSYFTLLSYIGLTSYYWAAAVQTFFYARYGRYPLRRWPRLLQGLHVLLQSTITVFPFIVTIIFWAILSSSQTFATTLDAWENISIHAMNSAFALFEILFSNSPPAPWLMIPFQILMLCGYLAVAYITHVTQGFYTYSFLDPANGGGQLAGYIIGIAVGDVLLFAIARGVAVLRQRYALRSGRLAKGDGDGLGGSAEAIDEWQEIERPVAGGKKEQGEGEAPRVTDSGLGAEAEAV